MNGLEVNTIAFALANFGIFVGYVFLAVAIAPHFEVTLKRTKWGAIVFFLTCGLTHLEMAYHTVTHSVMVVDPGWHMQLIHIPQLIAIWMFVWGLYLEMVKGRGVWPAQIAPRMKDKEDL